MMLRCVSSPIGILARAEAQRAAALGMALVGLGWLPGRPTSAAPASAVVVFRKLRRVRSGPLLCASPDMDVASQIFSLWAESGYVDQRLLVTPSRRDRADRFGSRGIKALVRDAK